MNEQKEIWYKDVIDLGFKDEKSLDNVFKNHYGHDYHIVTLEHKKIMFEWDTVDRTVRMLRTDKQGTILGELPIMDLNHLKEMMKFYGLLGYEKEPQITLA